MANPRNTVDFEGIGEEYSTFKIDAVTITYDSTQKNGAAATAIGKAVTLSADGTVALADDNQTVVGKLVLVEADGKATVQTGGFMKLPGGNGATLTLGARIIGAQGAAAAKGYIKAIPAAGAAYVQAEQQNTDKGRGMIVDASVTTAVVVRL